MARRGEADALLVSPAAQALLGAGANEPALVRSVVASLRSAQPNGHPTKFQIEIARSDGARTPLAVARESVADRDLELWVLRPDDDASARTERSRAHTQFQRLLDTAPDAVAVFGHSGLLYANPALLRWLGFPNIERLSLARVPELVHTDDAPRVVEAVRALLGKPGTRAVVRFRTRPASGALVDVEALGLASEWEGMEAVLVVARDVSQRRLSQSRAIAADRSASLGTLSAGVAHEINNPLAYVLLNLEYLIRELPRMTPEPANLAHAKERLAEARHGAERVGFILQELTTLAGRRRGRIRGVDLADVLRRCLRSTERELADVRVEVALGASPRVDADAHGLEQVFVNLLINAAQSLPAEGEGERTIRVQLGATDDASAVVEISDSGAGIAPEHMHRIFDPFFTTKPTGTGLGLPISHAIVRTAGGQITAESELGRGSAFRVVLPKGTAPRSDTDTELRAAVIGSARARILIVDDEELVAQTLSRALEETHEVSVCMSGREALERLSEDSGFDVVLCDLLMPDTTGMDLYAALAERQPGLESRLVFMTGGAFTRRASEFLARVQNPTLEKPFDVSRLEAIVARQLAKRGPG